MITKIQETVISPQRKLIGQDVKKWLLNIAVFSMPALLVLLGDLRNLIPENASYGALALALYGLVVDLLKKWYNENKYNK